MSPTQHPAILIALGLVAIAVWASFLGWLLSSRPEEIKTDFDTITRRNER